jgi:hypothetical protein
MTPMSTARTVGLDWRTYAGTDDGRGTDRTLDKNALR